MNWFQSLGIVERVFAICAIPATIILALQTVFLLIGFGDSGGDMPNEIGDGVDIQDTGLQLFTVRGFVTFFTLFGWTGLVCLQVGMLSIASVFLAFAVGAIGMILTAWALKSVSKLQSDGSLDLQNAIGKTATVYIRIPAKRKERGKVNLVIQEKMIEVSAVTDEEYDLMTGNEVVVVGMSTNDTLLVAVKNHESITI